MTALSIDSPKPEEAMVPGTGRRLPARSFVATDAPVLELTDGRAWHFRWSPSPAAPTDFLEEGWTPDGWDEIVLPAHWVMPGQPGQDRPIYTNVVYPIPLDPPHVPDDNPTGDHVLDFELPADWPADGEHHLRTDGIESFAQIWLNDTEVGTRFGSRLVQDFDVTGLLRPGRNRLAIRVTKWSSGTFLEDQDQWWLPGIFRSVSLRHRPVGALRDVWLDGDFADGAGTLAVELDAPADAWPVRLEVPELGISESFAGPDDVAPITVDEVEPWSAESPRLYDAVVTTTGEQVCLRVGFRRIDIDGGVLKVNGRRIILRGVNRHEIDPFHGRVMDLDTAREELLLMKSANVDAVRTAHYPPDPRWLDLADELGVWVVLECDLETHGFEYSGWQGNPSDDPAWREQLMDRIERTFERDKNHPSIIMWSLGNESWDGQNLAEMGRWLKDRDATRPIMYEGDRGGAYTDIYSRMYPAFEEIDAWRAPSGPVAVAHHPASRVNDEQAARIRSMPYLMVEYLHAMGTGPGAAAQYAAIVESDERLCGGFVWEWKNHAIAVPQDDGSIHWAYGGDFGEVVHDGNFVCDGLVGATLKPHPGLHDWAQTVAPVRATWDDGEIVVESLRHFTTTADLKLAWRVEVDGVPTATGELPLGDQEPSSTRRVQAPAELAEALAAASGQVATVTLEVQQGEARPWAPTGHVLARRHAAVELGGADAVAVEAPELEPVADFDPLGHLTRLGGLELRERGIDLWRNPIDNDEGHGALDYEAADPRETLGAGGGKRGPSSADRWREAGLDRLIARTEGLRRDADTLEVVRYLAPANEQYGVHTTLTWSVPGERPQSLTGLGDDDLAWLRCRIEVAPAGQWPGTWPRVGLHLELPLLEGLTARWFGLGPDETWPDQRSAGWLGRHELPARELITPHVRPQASGHRSEFRELALLDGDRPVLVAQVLGEPIGFSLSQWSPVESQVRHEHELPTPTAWHLHLDLAQHGVGSRACGPDVRPESQLWPRPLSADLLLAAPPAD